VAKGRRLLRNVFQNREHGQAEDQRGDEQAEAGEQKAGHEIAVGGVPFLSAAERDGSVLQDGQHGHGDAKERDQAGESEAEASQRSFDYFNPVHG
jgi:hypothetical protein